jgi:hypothetical protein
LKSCIRPWKHPDLSDSAHSHSTDSYSVSQMLFDDIYK